MEKSDLKTYIEHYNINIQELNNLNNKFKAITYKTISSYGQSFTAAGGGFNSKVEDYIIKQDDITRKIKNIEREIHIVDIAVNCLNEKERKVVEAMKIFKTKTKLIARALGDTRINVISTRDKALKKMCEFLNNIGGNK